MYLKFVQEFAAKYHCKFQMYDDVRAKLNCDIAAFSLHKKFWLFLITHDTWYSRSRFLVLITQQYPEIATFSQSIKQGIKHLFPAHPSNQSIYQSFFTQKIWRIWLNAAVLHTYYERKEHGWLVLCVCIVWGIMVLEFQGSFGQQEILAMTGGKHGCIDCWFQDRTYQCLLPCHIVLFRVMANIFRSKEILCINCPNLSR